MNNQSKEIIVLLKKEADNVYLEFDFEPNKKLINLCSNDTEQIKETFLELIKILKKEDISLTLNLDESINDGESQLFIDSSKEYIDQLTKEIASLKESEELKVIREKYSEE